MYLVYHVFGVQLEKLDNAKYTWNPRQPEYQCKRTQKIPLVQKHHLLKTYKEDGVETDYFTKKIKDYNVCASALF